MPCLLMTFEFPQRGNVKVIKYVRIASYRAGYTIDVGYGPIMKVSYVCALNGIIN